MNEQIASLMKLAREDASSQLWSQAVQLTRRARFQLFEGADAQLHLRLVESDRAVSPQVQLWPEDEAWSCDCRADEDPCIHVLAALIAVKSGQVERQGEEGSSKAQTSELCYQFEKVGEQLQLRRYLRTSDGSQKALQGTLTQLVGGLRSGRIPGEPLAVTSQDLAVDPLLDNVNDAEPGSFPALLQGLLFLPGVEYRGVMRKISLEPVRLRAVVRSESDTRGKKGFRVATASELVVDEVFANPAVLAENTVRPLVLPSLPPALTAILSDEGMFFPEAKRDYLFLSVIPMLKKEMALEFVGLAHVPEYQPLPPRIILDTSSLDNGHTLLVTPRIVYGEPPIAELLQVPHSADVTLSLRGSQHAVLPLRDLLQERALRQELRNDLHLQLFQTSTFKGEAAIEMLKRAKGYARGEEHASAFETVHTLVPQLSLAEQSDDSQGLQLNFGVSNAEGQSNTKGTIAFAEILRAYTQGQRYVRLPDGQWAEVPKSWLTRYADAARELLSARLPSNAAAIQRLPAAIEFAEYAQLALPAPLEELRERLRAEVDPLESYQLPDDLQAQLREYQKVGIAWMQSLATLGFGALLADDMGLGKTLQAMCLFTDKTLVIAPTSVIYSWAEQLAQFRPSLRCCLYHGSKRQFDEDAAVVLTTYTLARQEQELFLDHSWQTIVLDEAQNIKNAESQTARVIHQLEGQFRLALTGTPIENSSEDLWSIFRFINPGLLGSKKSFQSHFSKAISAGDVQAQERLRKRVQPFMLRRRKRDVAPELPPKTAITLYAEFSEQEREVYRAILTATKTEVLEKLEQGASVFSVLESLLRLRQVCCYPALVPGVSLEQSAKLDLLMDSLISCGQAGHRALVFSQWTSVLDVLEPRLQSQGIEYFRLDGSTKDRERLVREFQSESGPAVFLLSLKAGGAGLTLTAADHVYLIDPWWNPAVEEQAADRVHRIGQDKPVLLHRLIVKDSIEEKIRHLQDRKQALAEAITEGTQGGDIRLTRKDVLDLLDEVESQ